MSYELKGVEFDLLLAAYILNPNNTKEDFRVIVSNFEYDDVSYLEEVYQKGVKYSVPSIDKYSLYAVKKAKAIKELKKEMVKELKANNQYDLFYDIELPLSSVLAGMESTGINVDMDLLHKLNYENKEKIDKLVLEIHSLAGVEFNLPYAKKTKTGYSTNVDILNKLRYHHPIIEKIMSYRTLSKLYSTYIVGLENSVLSDGKIHTIYRQAFTSTGRLSSVEPNLQNIPIRYAEGREIRKVFIPQKGNLLLIIMKIFIQ